MIRLYEQQFDKTKIIQYFNKLLNLGYPTKFSDNPYLELVYHDVPSSTYDSILQMIITSSLFSKLKSSTVGTVEDITYKYNGNPKYVINLLRDYSSRNSSIVIRLLTNNRTTRTN